MAGRRRAAICVAIALVVGFVPGGGVRDAAADARAFGDTRVFATVPPPRGLGPAHPGGVLVDGDTVYVNTFNPVFRALDGYDAIFSYDVATGTPRTGRPEPVVIPRRTPATIMGMAGMAVDADGRLFVADMTGQILRVDPLTGARTTYATFPTDSQTSLTNMPGDVVFDGLGNLYVTDTSAPIVWRVAAGGGEAEPLLVDPLLQGGWGYGFAGIALDPTGQYIYFAGHVGNAAAVFRFPIDRPSPAAVELVRLYEPRGLFGAADIAFGASGKLYVVLLGAGQVSVLGPDHSEQARFPSAEQSAQQDVPYDDPLFVAFDGKGSMLLTNAAFSTPANSVVFDVWVDDTALEPARPSLPGGDADSSIGSASPPVSHAAADPGVASPMSCSFYPASGM